jgi:hypothetical protein
MKRNFMQAAGQALADGETQQAVFFRVPAAAGGAV